MLETLSQLPLAPRDAPPGVLEQPGPGERASSGREALDPDEAPVSRSDAPPGRRPRDGRLGKVLARRRPAIFAPLFLGAIALTVYDHARPPVGVAVAATVVLGVSWLLRIWATGYRTWVRGSGGVRHLMRAGPYAHLRHPLYVANGLAGAAALVLLGRLELLAVYLPLYALVTAAIVAREEQALDERYGREHDSYSALVPRFIPVPWRRVAASERAGTFSWRPIASGLELWKLAGLASAVGVVLFWGARA